MKGTFDISPDKIAGPVYGPVHMGLGSEMKDTAGTMVPEKGGQGRSIRDIRFNDLKKGRERRLIERSKVSSISQLVDADYPVIPPQRLPHHRRTDEPSGARNKQNRWRIGVRHRKVND